MLKNILFGYLIFFYCFSLSASSSPVLKHLPAEDRKTLECLFSYLFFNTTFPYTLFGDKPVSWEVISLPEFPKIRQFKRIVQPYGGKIPLWYMWKKWKNYEKSFLIKNFLIVEDINPIGTHRKDIFLINKRQFIKVVNQHQNLFHKSGEDLLREVEKTSSLRLVIKNNDLLFGILLGFGKYNSNLYQKREELKKLYEKYKHLLLPQAQIFKDLEENVNKITDILQPTEEIENLPKQVRTVQFVADQHHLETKALQLKYREQRNKILLVYSQESDILKNTIEKMIGE